MSDQERQEEEPKPAPPAELTQPLLQQANPKTPAEESNPKPLGALNSQTIQKDISVLSLLTAYPVTIAMLYLLGFWGPFRVNILQFIHISDIFKAVIYPLFFSVLGTMLLILIAPFIAAPEVFLESDSNVTKSFMKTPIERESLGWYVIMCIFGLLMGIWDGGGSYLFVYIMIAIGFCMFRNYGNLPILVGLIPNTYLRHKITQVGFLLLWCAYPWGRLNANKLMDGGFPCPVVSTNIFRAKANPGIISLLHGQSTLKYLGMAGDYFFFLSMDNSTTYVAKESDLYFLALTDTPTEKPSPTPTIASPSPSHALTLPKASPAKTGT